MRMLSKWLITMMKNMFNAGFLVGWRDPREASCEKA
jgi:hypothetical protein